VNLIDKYYEDIKPIKRLSASRLLSFSKCKIKEIWASNSSTQPLLAISPEARIGSVAHKILEYTVKGLVEDEDSLLQLWNNEIQKIELKMLQTNTEKYLIPLKSSKGYEVKLYQTLLICKRLLQYLKHSSSSVFPKPNTEVFVESKDKKLVGRIDLIRYTKKGVEIVDYKTGLVTNNEMDGNKIKDDYRKQMILYAALYHSTFNEWPIKLVLISLDNIEYEIPYLQAEATELLNYSINELNKANKIILEKDSINSLGTPAPTTCKFCLYRPVCKSYWIVRENSDDWPNDVRGILVEIRILGNGSVSLLLNFEQTTITIRGISNGRFDNNLVIGSYTYICNLIADSTKNYFIASPMTAFYQF